MDTLSNDYRAGGLAQALKDLPPTVSIEEAAGLCGISRSSAYRAAHRGELPAFRLGRKLRVPTVQLLHLLGVESDQRSLEAG